MARFQQREFVRAVGDQFPQFFQEAKVLEVGSWIANETVRDLFQSCD